MKKTEVKEMCVDPEEWSIFAPEMGESVVFISCDGEDRVLYALNMATGVLLTTTVQEKAPRRNSSGTMSVSTVFVPGEWYHDNAGAFTSNRDLIFDSEGGVA
jgi:outer membrane protein assembly factor BamB